MKKLILVIGLVVALMVVASLPSVDAQRGRGGYGRGGYGRGGYGRGWGRGYGYGGYGRGYGGYGRGYGGGYGYGGGFGGFGTGLLTGALVGTAIGSASSPQYVAAPAATGSLNPCLASSSAYPWYFEGNCYSACPAGSVVTTQNYCARI